MFCEKCGAQMDDNSAFCEKCGTPVQNNNAQANYNNMQGGFAPNNGMPVNQPVRIVLSKKQIIITAVAVVAVIAAIVLIATHKTTINLNNYLKPEFTGYNTVGTASVNFDSDAFDEKYSGKLRDKSGHVIDDPSYMVEYYLGGYTAYQKKLSNGDVVNYEWPFDPEVLAKELGCKIKCENTSFTVEGLGEVATIDPFQYVEVEFSGVAPNGEMDYKNNYGDDSIYGEFYISADKTYGLSNGDEVTLTVGDFTYTNEQLAIEYGKVLSSETKTYTVEGLGSYLESADQITDEAVSEMFEQSKDILTAYIAKNWDSNEETLDSVENGGLYVMKAKNPDSYNSLGNSCVYVLLKVTKHVVGDEYNQSSAYVLYYPIRFDDILIEADGTCTVDTSNYRTTGGSFTYKAPRGEGGKSSKSYYEDGYESLDKFMEKCVNAYADSYTYELKEAK